MPDAITAFGALAAGALCGSAVLVACGGVQPIGAQARLTRHLTRPAIARALHLRHARKRLTLDIERAGWRESPERIAALAIALSACLAILGAMASAAIRSGLSRQ